MYTDAPIRGTCSCGRPCKTNGTTKLGHPKYTKYCSRCAKKRWGKGKNSSRVPSYRKHKKPQCEHCGFVGLHRCQLDVDHIDGNHSNNDPANLQTLCANCHRLKTFLQLHT